MARGRRGKGKNQAKRFLLAVIALVLAAVYPVQEQLTKETGGTAVSDGSTLEVHYLDIGQGDCTLIRQGDHAMLIDAATTARVRRYRPIWKIRVSTIWITSSAPIRTQITSAAWT